VKKIILRQEIKGDAFPGNAVKGEQHIGKKLLAALSAFALFLILCVGSYALAADQVECIIQYYGPNANDGKIWVNGYSKVTQWTIECTCGRTGGHKLSKSTVYDQIQAAKEKVEDGYNLKGWSIKSSSPSYVSQFSQYQTGNMGIQQYQMNSYYDLESNKLYFFAQAKPTTSYTLTYNANGGSGAPSQQSSSSSAASHTFTISNVQPTRSGYTFLGWANQSNATEPQYVSSDSSKNTITLTSGSPSKTIYAVWRENEDAAPDMPAISFISNLVGNITLNCTTAPLQANGVYEMTDTYGGEAGYTLGTITPADNGAYTLTVTIKPEVYLNIYNETWAGHSLKSGQSSERTVVLEYKNSSWSVKSKESLEYLIVCSKPEGGMPGGSSSEVSNEERTLRCAIVYYGANGYIKEVSDFWHVNYTCANKASHIPDENGSHGLPKSVISAQYTAAQQKKKGSDPISGWFAYGTHYSYTAAVPNGGKGWPAPSAFTSEVQHILGNYNLYFVVNASNDEEDVPPPTNPDPEPDDPVDTPPEPTHNYLLDLIGNIEVDCLTTALQVDGVYSLIKDSYAMGSITDKGNGVYEMGVSIDADKYIEKYNQTWKGHVKANGESGVRQVTLQFKDGDWSVISGKPVPAFKVICEKPEGGTPGDPDEVSNEERTIRCAIVYYGTNGIVADRSDFWLVNYTCTNTADHIPDENGSHGLPKQVIVDEYHKLGEKLRDDVSDVEGWYTYGTHYSFTSQLPNNCRPWPIPAGAEVNESQHVLGYYDLYFVAYVDEAPDHPTPDPDEDDIHPEDDIPDEIDLTKTGDESLLALWIGLLVSIPACMSYARKRIKN